VRRDPHSYRAPRRRGANAGRSAAGRTPRGSRRSFPRGPLRPQRRRTSAVTCGVLRGPRASLPRPARQASARARLRGRPLPDARGRSRGVVAPARSSRADRRTAVVTAHRANPPTAIGSSCSCGACPRREVHALLPDRAA
jgi:hypothetical protein